jgi:myo-inositol-1(or 4)-monophosphatase
MNLSHLCQSIEEIACEAGDFILSEAAGFDKGKVEFKGFNDFVSYVDRGAEKMLAEKLGILLPEAGFIAEEGTVTREGQKYSWIVDPLDGTTNFIHGLHPYAVSIALREYDSVVAGVVYEVSCKNRFTAWEGGGAWHNGRRISVSDADRAAGCLAATGFPYKDFSRMPSYMKCLDWMLRNTHGVRRMGSAAIDLCYVACGKYEIFFEYGLNPWDVAAGAMIVREAGGMVSDFSGREGYITGDEVLASNGMVHREILEIISKFMRE